jgi:hypothetical protein
MLRREQQRRDDQVAGGVRHPVGEPAERRGQPLPHLQLRRECTHGGADRERRDQGGGGDGLFEAGGAGHRVAEHLRPAGNSLDAGEVRAALPGAGQQRRRGQRRRGGQQRGDGPPRQRADGDARDRGARETGGAALPPPARPRGPWGKPWCGRGGGAAEPRDDQ